MAAERAMDVKKLAEVFSAIGQPTRLEILRYVADRSRGENPQGVAAGEIAEKLKVAPATLSFHLKDMTFKGVLQSRRVGRSIYYSADINLLLQVLDIFVSEICEE